MSIIEVIYKYMESRLKFYLSLACRQAKVKFESTLHNVQYLYPFMQSIILLPMLPYLYIDRNELSMVF